MHKGQHARLKLNHPIKHTLPANIRLIKIKHKFSQACSNLPVIFQEKKVSEYNRDYL